MQAESTASSSSPSRGPHVPPPISCQSITTKARRSQHQDRANLSIPPPRSQRFEQISAVVIPKARTPRQPSAPYPLIEPKVFHNFCHVLCSYISQKPKFGAPSSPPPRGLTKALPPFPPAARYGSQNSPPPLMLQWLLYPALHVASGSRPWGQI